MKDNSRLLLEAVQLLQFHKVKRKKVPVYLKFIDYTLAILIFVGWWWGVLKLFLWLTK